MCTLYGASEGRSVHCCCFVHLLAIVYAGMLWKNVVACDVSVVFFKDKLTLLKFSFHLSLLVFLAVNLARLSPRSSVCPSVCPFVHHTGGSVKNSAR